MYRAGKTDWIHKPTVLRGVGAAARDESISRYWSLTEEETSVRRDDGGRAGYWRITGLGERFVLAAVRVPKYAHIYDGSCLRLSGDPVSIVDCLGDRFNYRELMGM